ncbi:MAG: class I tRNA ligase family protein, partial [Clostridiales bacterium]|nr:class I tRNA ligase family protein [Clostridiales bacterium]
WKFKKEGEPFWGSPWGEGRPGWHIECSAMIKQYLGDTIDIHGGGQDLIFPHHENEIAQSEAANGCTFCNYWVHNAFVNIDGEKMSKSLGNFFTIRDIAQKYPYNVIRFFILLGHYRSPINFSDELLAAAQTSLGRISNCVRNAEFVLSSGSFAGDEEADKQLSDAVNAASESFVSHMDDDLNSADAITDIFNLVRQTNTSAQEGKVSASALKAAKDKILELTGVLGIVLDLEDEIPEEITELANKRAEAKKAKDYAEADRIRNEIQAKGYTVKDVPGGFKIEKA